MKILNCVVACLWIGHAVGQETVSVTAGATASLTRPAGRDRESFNVAAKAGQSLLVEINVSNVEKSNSSDQLHIFPPGGGTKPLTSTLSEDISAHVMSVLPNAGVYRVEVFRSSKKAYDLRITLMDPNDPRIDPGITAAKLSINTGTIGKKGPFRLKPIYPVVMGDADEFWPASLVLEEPDIRVMSLDGLKKTHWMDDRGWLKALAGLEAALKPGTKPIAPKALPPSSPDADLIMGARPETLEGKSFRAIRFIASYSQAEDPPHNPMEYVAQGISSDGRYYVMMRAKISHPAVDAEAKTKLPSGEKQYAAAVRAVTARIVPKLEAAAPDSFKPSLAQLDAVFKSLTIQ